MRATTIGGPGAGDELDPFDLDDVRARVVDPVLSALLEPGEWTDAVVDLVRDAVHVRVWLLGDLAEREVWRYEAGGTLGDAAALVVDLVEDAVAESPLGWGQWRAGDVVIPARPV